MLYIKWLPIHKLKNKKQKIQTVQKYKLYNCADDFKYNTVHVQKRDIQAAGWGTV